MSLFTTHCPSMGVKLESMPPAYHTQPLYRGATPGYAETDPDELRRSDPPTPAGSTTPIRSLSRPVTPFPSSASSPDGEGIGMVQTLRCPQINLLRLIAACCLNFCNGINDAAPGALIPYMEKHYGIGYAIVSLIFLSNAAGFIFSATISQVTYARIGRARTVLVGVLMMVLAYVVASVTPPFGAVVMSFFLMGGGMSLILAQCNVFASSLAGSTTAFGYVHGAYGLGGTISPLIATAMASRGILWSRFYLLLLGIAIFNSFLATYAFWNSEKDSTPVRLPGGNTGVLSTKDILRKSIKNKYTLLTAIFIFAYQGAEVAIGGWTISFLITARAGDPAEVGYVVSGFWAGITVGRLALSHLCTRIGERLSVFILTAGSIIFQVLVWTVPNIISNAVSIALVGLLLGPLYPCVMTITTKLIDRRLHVSSLTFISAFGSSGGAIAPFTTGMLASKFGAWVLHPVSIGMFVAMEGIWFLLPKVRKRDE
ncbi:unnamed protein product [Tuber melanosporum]|uniref:(Perigord truffle) hypothetical protein n=1 Tax=Tuber melanosporum (strain Mel28) TaxID=656061 RepID=D5GEU7_TUBMM|nr:uncharacterized protein GSTUM_00001400001 [Tuber melanosporum]CAZ83040.1 unnamed protein product [Tuber melanosporum]